MSESAVLFAGPANYAVVRYSGVFAGNTGEAVCAVPAVAVRVRVR
jgi:hypothetical protein